MSQKQGDTYATELIAQIAKPDKAKVMKLLYDLANKYQAVFMVDSYMNFEMIAELRNRGINVAGMSLKDHVQASNMVFANIVNGKIAHSHDPIITAQINSAVRKNIGDTWRISRKDSLTDIDGAMATVMSIWGSDQELISLPMIN